MIEVASEEHQTLAGKIRASMAVYADAEDLINIGAYAPGSNPQIDSAIELHPRITGFLQQEVTEASPWPDTLARLKQVVNDDQ